MLNYRYILVILIFTFSSIAAYPSSATAFSCTGVSTQVGIVKRILKDNNDLKKIELSKVHFFSLPEEIYEKNIPLDFFEKIAQTYPNSEDLTASKNKFHYIDNIPEEYLKRLDIDIGEMIMVSPMAGHGCLYNFWAVFTPSGKLKIAEISTTFDKSIQFRNTLIEMSAGEDISCDDNLCSVKTNFLIDSKEKFSLVEGESKKLKSLKNDINKLSLITANLRPEDKKDVRGLASFLYSEGLTFSITPATELDNPFKKPWYSKIWQWLVGLINF